MIKQFPQYMVVYMPYTLKSKTAPATLTSIDRAQLYEPDDGASWLRDTRGGLFEMAEASDVGVITVKPFSAGQIFSAARPGFGAPDNSTEQDRELARLTLAYILSNPNISAVAVGMTLPSQVDNNVRACFEGRAKLDEDDRRKLDVAAARMWAALPPQYAWLRQWQWA